MAKECSDLGRRVDCFVGFSRKILVKVQLDLAGRGWLQYSYFQK